MSDSVRPHRWQPTRLLRPWDSAGKNTGVGVRKAAASVHIVLNCMFLLSVSFGQSIVIQDLSFFIYEVKHLEKMNLNSLWFLKYWGYDFYKIRSWIWVVAKETATHSSVLACRIPGTEEPGGPPSMGSHRVRYDWSDLAAAAAAADMHMTPPLWQKVKRNKEPLDEG